MRAVGLAVLTALVGCHSGARPDPRARVTVATGSPVATVSDRFLSIAIDTAQLVGGLFWNPGHTGSGEELAPTPPFDFVRPRLLALARPLAPAYLRFGGTDADRTYYALGAVSPATPPDGYRWVLTRAQWNAASAFARALDFQIIFTLNAGSGPRVSNGPWRPDNARALVEYARQHHDPVAVWELGNEVNAYPLLLGFSLGAADYTRDMRTARALLAAAAPGARLAGPASAYWPLIGELNGLLPAFAKVGGDTVDVVSWHYYPQESRRCPVAVRAATPTTLLAPGNLDEIDRWADDVEAARRAHAPAAQAWLDETSNAQCGGAPGISDAFVSGLWWLDQLGKLARRGTPVVVRQSLTGADYGLLAEPSLDPRPDYFATVLWRRLMGTRVLGTTVRLPTVRAYAHCTPSDAPGWTPGAVTTLLINLDAARPVTVTLDGVGQGAQALYQVTADALTSTTAKLNGQALAVDAAGALPELSAAPGAGERVTLPAASYTFVVSPAAGAAACR